MADEGKLRRRPRLIGCGVPLVVLVGLLGVELQARATVRERAAANRAQLEGFSARVPDARRVLGEPLPGNAAWDYAALEWVEALIGAGERFSVQ